VSKRKKEMQPYWRPNFVNQSELPDIKVVRTDFIINFIAVTLAFCVAFLLLQREYRAYVLSDTIADMEQQIRVADADDIENLKLSESFRQSTQYIIELEKFFDAPLLAYDLVYQLAEIKPEDLIFNSISFNETITKKDGKDVLAYSINLAGDAKDLTVVGEFKKILEQAELLRIPGFEVEISETLQGRDDRTQIFPYRLAITLTPSKKAAAEKSGGDAS